MGATSEHGWKCPIDVALQGLGQNPQGTILINTTLALFLCILSVFIFKG